MKMKRFFGFCLVGILAVLVLVSCATAKIPAELLAYEQYSTPYQLKNDGNLHFYFMASMGMKMTNTDGDAQKWGDSCLILLPDGETVLVDAGMADYAPLLALNLMKMGVSRIDYIIITHPHNDHAAGIYNREKTILQYFEVGKCYYNGAYNNSWSNIHQLEDILDDYGVPREVLKEGDELELGGVSFRILNPPADVAGAVYTLTPDVNNSSIVFRMDYGDFSALFTGDIYAAKEWDLVERFPELLDVDLLKVPHHGHNTSSTREFGAAVTPKLAVATSHVAMDLNSYMSYTRTGSQVLMDFCDGYVHVWSDGTGLDYEHSKERTIRMYVGYGPEAFAGQ